MADPLQYLRDLQFPAIPRAPAPRVAPAAKSPCAPGFADPADLPALALSILAEGRPAKPAAGRLVLQRRTLPDGGRCSLPIRYFDARCLIAAFAVERSRVTEALNGTGLRAAGTGDSASVLYGCFEYRDSDLGPYNEVGLSIPAQAPGEAEPALYVAHLPVSTPETDLVGRALWGYPKFVAGIDVRGDGRAFSTALRDPEGLSIARLEGVFAAMKTSPPTDLPTYSYLNGQLLRTRIEPLTPFQEGAGAGFALKVGPSRHPMAETLRALGLDGARPVGIRYAEPFQAMLYPGFPA